MLLIFNPVETVRARRLAGAWAALEPLPQGGGGHAVSWVKPLEIGKKLAENRGATINDETTAPEPQPGLQGEGGDRGHQG